MKFIQGYNRNQIALFPISLDESIEPDNEVRIIDLFVESLYIKDFEFRKDFVENILPAGNVRRIGNILSGNRLKEYLGILWLSFLIFFAFLRRKLSSFETFVFQYSFLSQCKIRTVPLYSFKTSEKLIQKTFLDRLRLCAILKPSSHKKETVNYDNVVTFV